MYMCIVIIVTPIPWNNPPQDYTKQSSVKPSSLHVNRLESYMDVCFHMTKFRVVYFLNSYSASRDNSCTVGGDGGCRVGEVRAGTTSPMPDHKGFNLQELVNFLKFSTLRVKIDGI